MNLDLDHGGMLIINEFLFLCILLILKGDQYTHKILMLNLYTSRVPFN